LVRPRGQTGPLGTAALGAVSSADEDPRQPAQVAAAKAPSLLTADPAEAMQIAADEGSVVGDYTGPFAFQGAIDEVRIWHLPREGESSPPIPRAGTGKGVIDWTLAYSFDRGRASDISGHENHGEVSGITVIAGHEGRGQALRFTGRVGASSGFTVEHHWAQEIPILARAMVLAGETLFVAGPPDLIDEEQAFKRMDDPAIRPQLNSQAASLAGTKGALLIAVSARDGQEQARWTLPSPPVFDGMAAAGGRLYLTAMDGSVCCFASQGEAAAGDNPGSHPLSKAH